jgi:methionyl aminopeptidase
MISYKTKEEIKVLRESGKILANVLHTAKDMVVPGISTMDLEKKALELIEKAGGKPAFKGFLIGRRPFPSALCLSINDEIVHAPATPTRILNEGDIVGIDVGMAYPFENKMLFTDTALSVGVGKIDEDRKKLLEVTKKSLELGIEQVKPGNTLNDIGSAIENYVKANGFSIVRDLVGHGVGHKVHEEPQVPHYKIVDNSLDNIVLKPGLVIAIEPMVNIGESGVVVGDDGFTFKTADGSLSAQFEHSIAVTEEGHIVLTAL